MNRSTRDLATAAGIAGAIVVSLITVCVTASEPPASATATSTTAQSLPAAPIAIGAGPLPVTTSPANDSVGVSRAPASAAEQPPVTLVLSSGAAVVPRLDRTPRTPRPAPTPPVITEDPASPEATPDPQVFQDPATVATAWLTALCWYDDRGTRDDNIRRAAVYGDTVMPPWQDPWTLDDQAWAHITMADMSSACTNIHPTVETVTRDGTEETTVDLTATQVLSAAGTAYQSAAVNITRSVRHASDGRWLVGPAVTAN